MVRAEPELFAHLPVIGLGDRLWADVPGWSRALEPAATRIGEYVSDEELAGLRIPTLHIGGWYDPLLAATLRQWEVTGVAAVPRPERSLIIGPWSHKLTATGTVLGDRDYGTDSQIRLGKLEREWVSHVLGFAERSAPPTVHIFLMEENRWVNPNSWPPDRGGETILYVAPRRVLQAQQSTAIGSETYCYDPRDPFPSRPLPSDRADLDARHDALRYTSLPLREELVIAGRPYAILDAESDCSSTDFVVRLLEQKPDGSVLPISRGCVIVDIAGGCGSRASHRIPLTPTATMVRAGHRLRLEITSSDFPDLARNLNTGADRYRSADVRIARQRVWHGGDNPTRVILPTGGLP